ncbi:glycosyltransferase family 4 protein [Bacillus toyonensis]|uniref:glycosyltransferase family 4 protein n=1 Tax=Bacillus toyonensis TaxID=155322 RepID=UPI000BF15DFF|nr:glycosyltransferase family 4 protein [Bacillus toyonensis]PEJ65951.1 glycosyltransferase WbuB [Bacillus toyonensis]PEN73260.1 glycosyltransferase WbuB [Bacillus toyonensis]PGB35495.1 glycosyltransferase WbuB [Bacillus toyonensis]
MKKKKIVFVINYFYPDFASTGQLMTELCLDLQNDFDITVIAAQPNYAGENVSSKKVFEEDRLENMKIVRIRLPEVDKTSKFSRMKYIFSYFALANIALLKEKGVDIIYTISQPPVLGGLIGTIGKFLKRAKHVYNVQDFNPEQAAAVSYTNKQSVFKIAKKIDMLNCKYSDCVIVVGNDMSETLKQRFNGKKVPDHTVINNWTNEQEVIPLDKSNEHIQQFLKDNDLEDKFIIMYSGNIGLYYDLENIIHVTNHFKEYKDIAFVFIGEGAVKKDMQGFVEDSDIQNVFFLPYQPKEFIKYSLNVADVHLVVNQKGIKGVSVPSKIYGVMAAGKPILGVLEQGSEAQMLIEKSKSGIVVEPQDYKGIIRTIEQFYRMEESHVKEMGLNGRKYLDENLKREISINKYRNLLKQISKS